MSRFSALREFIALDFETSGLTAGEDAIIDIGAVRYRNGEEIARFTTLVNPQRMLSPEITQLTGITNEELMTAPVLGEISKEFRDFLGQLPVMAHNAKFEKSFLQDIFGLSYSPVMLDTFQVLTLMYPLSPSHSLEYFIRTFELRSYELHRGLQDALDMVEIIRICDSYLDGEEFAPLCAIIEERLGAGAFQPQNEAWAWLPFFLERHQADAPKLRNFRQIFSGQERAAIEGTMKEAPLQLGKPEFFAQEFSRYQVRSAQQTMAERCADTLREDGIYVVEAGTGTGKTLAYSTGILSSLAADTTTPVVVSTHTKVLQDQFLGHEIPRLKRLFNLPNLHAIALKGMGNYACLRKLTEVLPQSDQLFAQQMDINEQFAAAFLEHWIYRTAEGGMEELPRSLFELPVIEQVRSHARADYRDCTRRQCAFYEQCYYFKKEWEAESAHILAVNHSLLMSYPRTYPAFSRLVVDEADELYGEALETFSRVASHAGMRDVMHVLLGAQGVMDRVLYIALHTVDSTQGSVLPKREEVAAHLYRWNEVLARLDTQLRGLYVGELFTLQIPMSDQRLTDEQRQWIFQAMEDLNVICNDILYLGRSMDRALDTAKLNEDSVPDMKEMHLRLDDVENTQATLQQFLAQDERKAAIYLRIEREDWALVITPFNIGELFAENVLAGLQASVFTSATISASRDMQDFIANMGLDFGKKPVLVDRFPSPFDYRRNSRLIFLKGMPRNNAENFPVKAADFIAQVAEMLGGRTLVLFTSKDRLRKTHEMLMPQLQRFGIDVITHGVTNFSMGKCIEQFKNTDQAVLLGARGMWKGVDIPGEALQCVIIDKMPYAVPNPFTKGLQNTLIEEFRTKAMEKGEDPDPSRLSALAWNAVDKPLMFQAFRQMFGRLIRTETDQGIMVVLDPQLQSSGLTGRHRELLELLPDIPCRIAFPEQALREFEFLLPDPFASL